MRYVLLVLVAGRTDRDRRVHLVGLARRYPADRAARCRAASTPPRSSRRPAGGARRLRLLPHRSGRRALRRRACDADAVRHDLRQQHHPGPGDRHRQLVRRPRSAAPCARAWTGRPAAVPRVSLRPFQPWSATARRRRPVRLPDDARAGAGDHPAQRPAVPARLPRADRRLEATVLPPGARSIRTPRRARHGTAGPTWCRAWRIAAPAIRRAISSARRRRRGGWPAARPQGWYAYALDAASPAPVPWTADSALRLPAAGLAGAAWRRAGADGARSRTILARRAGRRPAGDRQLHRLADRHARARPVPPPTATRCRRARARRCIAAPARLPRRTAAARRSAASTWRAAPPLHAPNPTNLANIMSTGIPASGEERRADHAGLRRRVDRPPDRRSCSPICAPVSARRTRWDGIGDAVQAARPTPLRARQPDDQLNVNGAGP